MAGVGLTESELTFALRVKQCRQWRGWTQVGLADRLRVHGVNLDQAAIARIEKGKRRVLMIEALRLAQALETPVSQLLNAVTCDHCKDQPPAGFACPKCGAGSTSA